MQALAMGRECAFLPGEAATGYRVALAVFPPESPFFHTPLLVIVVRVVGASLPIQLALETAFLVLVGFEVATEREQSRLTFVRHHGHGGGPQIKTHLGRSHVMLRLLERNAFQDELGAVAVAISVSALCLMRRGTTDEPGART